MEKTISGGKGAGQSLRSGYREGRVPSRQHLGSFPDLGKVPSVGPEMSPSQSDQGMKQGQWVGCKGVHRPA